MGVTNPYVSGNFPDTFVQDSKGFVQGTYAANAVSKNLLTVGKLASTETLPMWGGVAVQELMATDESGVNQIKRATNYATTTGFSVSAQTYHALVTTDNTVPVVPVGSDVQFFRLGSKARIYLPIDPALDLTTLQIGEPVSFDFTTGEIIAFDTTALNVKVLRIIQNSLTVSYDTGTGNATWYIDPVAEVEI